MKIFYNRENYIVYMIQKYLQTAPKGILGFWCQATFGGFEKYAF